MLDLKYVRNMCEQIGTALREKDGFHVVVVRSTMLPGSMQDLVMPTLEESYGKISGKGYEKKHEIIDDVHMYRHNLSLEAEGALGYLMEYGTALFWEFVLAWRVLLARGLVAIHACNPPDNIFLMGGCFKLLGKKLLFNHHEMTPELYEIWLKSTLGKRMQSKVVVHIDANLRSKRHLQNSSSRSLAALKMCSNAHLLRVNSASACIFALPGNAN